MTNNPTNLVVCIGASAGGVEALKSLFSQMPVNSGAAFVVIQHLDPHYTSVMPELLTKYTKMAVHPIRDGLRIDSNQIYLLPAGVNLSIKDNFFIHIPPPAQEERSTRIDHFFSSLAQQFQERSLGIVLSGMGSDGSLGLRAIKDAGGMTIAQKPETAKFDSMPRNAIFSGVVDFILSLEEMPGKIQEFCDYFHDFSQHYQPEQFSKKFQKHQTKIIFHLHQHTGHDFSHYKKSTIIRRIRRRMQINKIETLEAYANLIQENSVEAHELLKDLLIGVTHFFRDINSWAFLEKDIIPALFQQAFEQSKNNPTIRLWVPGCSTGEEAYSFAILLQEFMEKKHQRVDVKIFATDIDSISLNIARRGLYPEGITECITPERLERFFIHDDSMYRVKTEVREMCIFSEHNLINNPPFSRINLISCRNLMIYFEPELQRRIFPIFHYALLPQGYLFLGASENASNEPELFCTINKSYRLFQAKETINRATDFPVVAAGLPGFSVGISDSHLQQKHTPLSDKDRSQFIRALDQIILNQFAPPGCVVNESGDIMYITGPITEFVQIHKGEARMNIIDMVNTSIRLTVRSCLRKASTKKTKIEKNIHFPIGNKAIAVRLIIRPLPDLKENSDLFLIIFSQRQTYRHSSETPVLHDTSKEQQEVIEQLEGELKNTRQELFATIEELKSSNEELLSMNEELQSSNEELQTSKEEMQSINEELQTVNTELNKKIEELDTSNSDIQNLYESTQLAILFLDNDLRIKGFTPFLQELFSVIQTDIGRSITDITPRFTYADFIAKARSVLHTLNRCVVEVQKPDTNQWYLMQITPYRDVGNKLKGLTVSFVDITQQKQTQKEINNLNLDIQNGASEMSTIFDLVPVGLAISRDSECRNIRLNRMASIILGLGDSEKDSSAKTTVDLGSCEFYNDDGPVPKEDQPMRKSVRTGKEVTTTDMWVRKKGATDVYLQTSAMPLFDASKKVRGVIGTFADITSLRQTQEQLKELNKSLEQRVNQLRQLSAQLSQVEQQERRKLSRVLHDNLQQLIVAAKLRLAKDYTSDNVKAAVELLDEATISARRLTVQLSPPIAFDCGLKGAFEWLVRWAIRELQLQVHFELRGEDTPCSEETGSFLFHATKEMLFNVFKHANVDEAWVILTIPQNSNISLEVMDKGIGVSRTLSETDTDTETGFGLFSIKERIEIIGGAFHIESSEGSGTKITLSLPLDVLQISNSKNLSRFQPEPSRAREVDDFVEAPGKVRVMLVDDHALVRDGLAWMIQDQPNMAVIGQAQTGQEALDLVETCQPHVILMDISLPHMNGIDVTREIKNRYPTICIIGLSMHEKDYVACQMLSAGAADYVSKSEASSELINTINKCLLDNPPSF